MNRYDDICALFNSLKRQNWPNIEVVFVADQSEQLAKMTERYLRSLQISNFKVILHHGEGGVNICRNIGIETSQGEIVGIVDDDVVLFPDWVTEMINSYKRDASIVGVTGPALPLWETPHKMSWFPKDLFFVWGCTVWDWSEEKEIRSVGGMNCSFRRDALLKAGLYKRGIGPRGGEEKIKWFYPSGEEVELSLRIRNTVQFSKIIYNPRVKIYHKVQNSRFNITFLIKRTFRFGYTRRYVESRFQNFSESPVIQLEREHLKHILFTSLPNFGKEFFKNPITSSKRLLTTWLGTLSTVIGYLAYFLKPYKDT